ncbi:7972_t:CDS:10, partial [Scutellospora calospora]
MSPPYNDDWSGLHSAWHRRYTAHANKSVPEVLSQFSGARDVQHKSMKSIFQEIILEREKRYTGKNYVIEGVKVLNEARFCSSDEIETIKANLENFITLIQNLNTHSTVTYVCKQQEPNEVTISKEKSEAHGRCSNNTFIVNDIDIRLKIEEWRQKSKHILEIHKQAITVSSSTTKARRLFEDIWDMMVNIMKDITLDQVTKDIISDQHDELSCSNLLADLRKYKRNENPFDMEYKNGSESPLNWWLTFDDDDYPLIELATKIFSIMLSQDAKETSPFWDELTHYKNDLTQQENITCIPNAKKSRVNGQDSQLDNDSEQSRVNIQDSQLDNSEQSRVNIQDSRLKNYSEQSPSASASAFSDHNEDLEDETHYTTISPSIESQQLTNDNNNEISSELLPYSDNKEFEDEIEEIDFNLMNISEELEREPTAKWEVGCVNVSDRFRKYQKDIFKKAERGSLKHANIYELLALSSILVLCWPCQYPIFTNREWREIMNTNPYTMNKPPLPQETSSSLREAASRRLSRGDVFMECGESDLNRLVALMFNNLYYGIPEVAPSKLSEEEHCDMFIYPIARSFHRSEKEYELRLNRTTSGSKSRPDLSCVVNDVLILNSEFKPLGCTPLQEKKDRLKAHLKARKSINQQLEIKGGPGESVIFLNIGSSMESYFMDLKYDGLYRSWSFLTTKLVVDKNTIPLAEFAISHLVALEERVEKIAVDFKYRSDQFTPPPQMSFLREFPDTPQELRSYDYTNLCINMGIRVWLQCRSKDVLRTGRILSVFLIRHLAESQELMQNNSLILSNFKRCHVPNLSAP